MGKRTDLSCVDIDLAMRLALYETHRFCIRMPTDASLLESDGTRRPELDSLTLSIFVHEYTHFTHNISTVSGWVTFEILIELLAVFSRSLNRDAICCPDNLSDSEREQAEVSAAALRSVEGDRRLPAYISKPLAYRVEAVTKRTESHQGVPFDIRTVRWHITHRDASVSTATTDVGAFMIEEGIAYLLESFAVSRNFIFDNAWTPDGGTPFYPYVAYQALCRFSSPSISPLATVKIGLLALNYNRPGEALIRTLGAYQRYRDVGRTDAEACALLKSEIAGSLAETSKRTRGENLTRLLPLFQGRGLLEVGVNQIVRWFDEGLSEREGDIWYDLDWCSGSTPNVDILLTRLRRNSPCDVIQERDGSESELGRDALITFSQSATGLDREILGGIRTFQAQLHYLLEHLTSTGTFVSTQQSARRGCPFYTVCKLKMRDDNPEICGTEPWSLWRNDPTCWYGAAVAGTLGEVEQVEGGTESSTT